MHQRDRGRERTKEKDVDLPVLVLVVGPINGRLGFNLDWELFDA